MWSKLDLKKIHMAMWVGLFINIGYSMAPVDVSGLNEYIQVSTDLPTIEEQIKRIASIFYFVTLFFQCVGILAFFVNPRAGLIISLCSSILTFNNSCVYILGAFLTYYRFRFADFAERPESDESSMVAFASSRSSVLLKNSLFLFLGSILFFWALPTLLGLFFFIIGVTVAFMTLVLGLRLKFIPALILYPSGLAILPHIMASSVFLPYRAIKAASLLAGSVIQFQVEMENGIHVVDLPLQNIRPGDRKTVVAKIADTMEAKGIKVY